MPEALCKVPIPTLKEVRKLAEIDATLELEDFIQEHVYPRLPELLYNEKICIQVPSHLRASLAQSLHRAGWAVDQTGAYTDIYKKETKWPKIYISFRKPGVICLAGIMLGWLIAGVGAAYSPGLALLGLAQFVLWCWIHGSRE